MVKETILRTIEEYGLIEKGHYVILGLSGGPDSVCLFDVLDKVKDDMGFSLSAVHVNHLFRPGAAEEDQAFTEELCKSRGIPCTSFVVDCHALAEEKGMTDEEAGRFARYDSFAKAADALVDAGIPREKIRISVAQNADDQAETVLFRIMRGTGTDGIAGITPMRTDEHCNVIIRPLLGVRKNEINRYCEENGLNPRTDHTNAETEYTRNRIRHMLIPYIEENFGGNITAALLRLSETAALDRDYFRKAAADFLDGYILEENKDYLLIDGKALKAIHPAVRQRVLTAGFGRIGLTRDLTFAHFKGCEEIVASENPSARADLPHGFYITRVYDNVRLAAEGADFDMKMPGVEPCKCDYDKVKSALGDGWEQRVVTRKRQPGDFIRIKGGGRKKIQNLLVDMKIPRDERDGVVVAACGSEVFVLAAKDGTVRYTSEYKTDENTKKVIYIEINRSL